jgi:hypothetical protein
LIKRVYTKLSSITSSSVVNFILDTSAVLIDAPTTFVVANPGGLKLTPGAGMNILPLSTVNGKYVMSTELGASITLRKLSSTSWIIEKMTGTWTVEP